MSSKLQSYIGLHISVLLMGGTALFSKLIHLSAVDITALRSIIGSIALLSLLLLTRQSLRLNTRKDYAIVITLGVLFALHWITLFHAMQVSTVAVGLIALFTFPVITVFLEPLFVGERPHWPDIFSGLLVIVGIYLMVPEFNIDNNTTLGVLWGVLSGFLYALRNVLQRHYFTHYPARITLFYQISVVALVVSPFLSGEAHGIETSQWLLLVLLGIVFTVLPHTLFANGLIHFKAKTASLVSCVQVVYSTLFALVLLGEVPTVATIIGGIIIVSAAAYESARLAK